MLLRLWFVLEIVILNFRGLQQVLGTFCCLFITLRKTQFLYLCPVSQLPSSFCLLVQLQERVRLPEEILEITIKVIPS